VQARELAIRAQDVEAGFSGLKDLPTFASAEFKNTILVGRAARLAAHIQGAEVFEESGVKRLEYVAASLGIEPVSLPLVLRLLEEADMVTVRERAGEIDRVLENVPRFADLHSKLGAVIGQRKLSELEVATLESYDQLAQAPRVDDGSLPIFGVAGPLQQPLLEIADQAGLIRRVEEKGSQPLLYSPQYWDENDEATARIFKSFDVEEVKRAYRDVRGEPGRPITSSHIKTDYDVVKRLADAGIFPSPSVHGLKGVFGFAFTPYKGFQDDPAVQSKRMEKVRALIACVRYGQHFGSGSKIKYPGAILNALLTRKSLAPHTDAYTQYKLLFDQGIVRLERLNPTSPYFVTSLIDTEENVLALQAAISLITQGMPIEATEINSEIRDYAKSSTYEEPVVARARRVYVPGSKSARIVYDAVQTILTT